MDETLRRQRDAALGQLEALIQRGCEIKNTRAPDAVRAWQGDCAAAINQLSGGSKGHWLARGYTGAFLVRSADGGVVAEADTAEIVDRMLGVLAAGVTSLSRMEEVEAASASSSAAPRAAPRPHPFEFVHDAELRPVLERALAASGDALERGEFSLALILSCGVIDALLTDALDHAQARDHKTPAGLAHRSLGGGGSFETRIAAAERAGLIGGGCARLPPVARTYRDLTDADGELRADAQVSQRDARLARQVLHVVLRDLDPGR